MQFCHPLKSEAQIVEHLTKFRQFCAQDSSEVKAFDADISNMIAYKYDGSFGTSSAELIYAQQRFYQFKQWMSSQTIDKEFKPKEVVKYTFINPSLKKHIRDFLSDDQNATGAYKLNFDQLLFNEQGNIDFLVHDLAFQMRHWAIATSNYALLANPNNFYHVLHLDRVKFLQKVKITDEDLKEDYDEKTGRGDDHIEKIIKDRLEKFAQNIEQDIGKVLDGTIVKMQSYNCLSPNRPCADNSTMKYRVILYLGGALFYRGSLSPYFFIAE